jgi:hypothetical protein
VDPNLLAVLLRESESTSLDFKRDQYKFVGATDDEKSELLKDILAFVNSWKHADAYILIGVDEKQANAAVGVSSHFDDASLQQFVNSKTQKPLVFSYETVPYQGRQIDVIKIPLQERPLYLKKDFGLLRKDTVYIRRGTSTDIASPAEVAEIGKASIAAVRTPSLRLEFIDPGAPKSLGTKIQLSSMIVQYEHGKIPSYSSNHGMFSAIVLHENTNYYRELAAYIRTIEFFKNFKLQVISTSGELAEDVALVLNVDQNPDVRFSSDKHSTRKPIRAGLNYNFKPFNYQTAYAVKTTATGSSLHVHFGNVRPKASCNPPGYFSIGSHAPALVSMEGFLYGNNIAEPIPVVLEIDVTVRHRELNLDELEDYSDN